MNYRLIFRSRYGQFAVWGLGAFTIFFVIVLWRVDGFAEMVAALPFPLGLLYFTWWIWSWPAVIADRRGVLIRNQVFTWHVPWDDLAKAEARWGLYVYADVHNPSTPAPGGIAEPTPGTIGAVDPVELDPENLANKKAIYAAAVPARGGLRAAAGKEKAPEMPPLDLPTRNRVVLRVVPSVAARMLEEEAHYVVSPQDRPESHRSRQGLADPGSPFTQVRRSFNWVQVAVFVAFAALWLARLL